MRTVLIGSDFMYNKSGDLVPIEINTNVGWHRFSIENTRLDFTKLKEFIQLHSFSKVIYIGSMETLSNELETLKTEMGFEFINHYVYRGSISIPNVDDGDDVLIIRSAYDSTAIVDDTYCRDKVNFLNLIKNTDYGSEFAYKDSNNSLVNNIISIKDNSIHPNFILKSRFPNYDSTQYPKLFRVNTIEELNTVLNQNLDSTNFLMEFHFNESNLYENHIKIFRGLNLLFPPNLESLSLGGYTYLPRLDLPQIIPPYDATTMELEQSHRSSYITEDSTIMGPKLLDTDLVEMADGTFKTANDLFIGDSVKTINIYNPNNVNLENEYSNFDITYDEFINNSNYTSNVITNKRRVSTVTEYVRINFTDGTYWEDTPNSSYLAIRNGKVRFLALRYTDELPDSNIDVLTGDTIILIDTSNSTEITTILKEVESITNSKQIFTGWLITVAENHMFLTVTSDNTSFAAIEHNTIGAACNTTAATCLSAKGVGGCAKTEWCVRTVQGTPCAGAGSANCICNSTCSSGA